MAPVTCGISQADGRDLQIPQEIPEKLGTVLYETLNADVKCQPKSKL